MTLTIKIIPVCLYIVVGLISLTMAYKNFFSNKLIPFQEQATGKSWDDIEQGIRFVIIALMKVSGLGFLVIALLLIVFPIVNLFQNVSFIQFAIPIISLFYCLGLFVFNCHLYLQTKVNTPWKRSLYAAIIISVGFILSLLL